MQPIRILLVENNPTDAFLFRQNLNCVPEGKFRITGVQDLHQALSSLDSNNYDVVLLDLSLPDSAGLDTLNTTHAHTPNVAIIVLTGQEDGELGLNALRAGAQDYLIKGQTDGSLLTRSMQYAIERQRLQEKIRALSLEDELTGLHNRRGFLLLLEQQFKQAERADCGLMLLFIDLDDMKKINDTLGHTVGDEALRETAELMRKTFRRSDIMARIGGDEFVIAALDARGVRPERLIKRLERNLVRRNAVPGREYTLALSIGATCVENTTSPNIIRILSEADAMMYEQKRSKKRLARLCEMPDTIAV